MNFIIRLIVIYLLCTLFFSCVHNKNIQYLQHTSSEKEVVIDSVLRNYDLVRYNYQLQPEDQIEIQFESLTPKEFDFLSSSVQLPVRPQEGNLQYSGKLIAPDGSIQFPFIGRIILAGKTLFEAEKYLQNVADEYLDSPIVRISLINFRITVLGEVVNEGTIPMVNNRVSLLEAIGSAGGLTDFAARDHVKIIRQKGDQTSVQYVNLLDENFLESPYYYVHPRDIIIVPPTKARPFLKYSQQNLTFLVTILNLALIVLTISRLN